MPPLPTLSSLVPPEERELMHLTQEEFCRAPGLAFPSRDNIRGRAQTASNDSLRRQKNGLATGWVRLEPRIASPV